MLEMITDIQLIGAKEAAKYLGVNPNTIYSLWKSGKLAWWNINGTKKTTKEAIRSFLFSTQNQDFHLESDTDM